MKDLFVRSILVIVLTAAFWAPAGAQPQVAAVPPPAAGNGSAPSGVALPAGYRIGPDDVLTVVFWRDKELSADVVVRPDGKISLPLLNDVQAAGSTPEELRAALVKAASKYIEDPSATVVVKEIRSRKVFISGNILKAGSYSLIGDKTIAQLIAEAGGLAEYADAKNIVVHREEEGRTQRFRFNYKDFMKGKNLQQNILLKPGDVIFIP